MSSLFECNLAISVQIEMIELSSDLVVSPLTAASIAEIVPGCKLVLIFVDTVPHDVAHFLKVVDFPLVKIFFEAAAFSSTL